MSESTEVLDIADEVKFLKQYVNDLQNQIDSLQDELNELKWSIINVLQGV